MTVRLTEAEARRLGITTAARRKKTTGKAVPAADCAPTRCVTCDAVFDRPVDEDRHFADRPTHRRYEMVVL